MKKKIITFIRNKFITISVALIMMLLVFLSPSNANINQVEFSCDKIPKGKHLVQNIDSDIRIRTKPSTGSIIKNWFSGETLYLNLSNTIEINGYIWAESKYGWNAICVKEDRGYRKWIEIIPDSGNHQEQELPYKPGTPKRKDLPELSISLLPVKIDDIIWIQYFGNTMFACHSKNLAKTYAENYQGLHGGIDFGINYGNIDSRKTVSITDGNVLRKNGNDISIGTGDYIIRYIHIMPYDFDSGHSIQAGDEIGKMHYDGKNSHIHLEISIRNNYGNWLINPLWLIDKDLRNKIIDKFYGEKDESYFYHTLKWDKWVDPMNQPVIESKGREIIGPLNREPGCIIIPE